MAEIDEAVVRAGALARAGDIDGAISLLRLNLQQPGSGPFLVRLVAGMGGLKAGRKEFATFGERDMPAEDLLAARVRLLLAEGKHRSLLRLAQDHPHIAAAQYGAACALVHMGSGKRAETAAANAITLEDAPRHRGVYLLAKLLQGEPMFGDLWLLAREYPLDTELLRALSVGAGRVADDAKEAEALASLGSLEPWDSIVWERYLSLVLRKGVGLSRAVDYVETIAPWFYSLPYWRARARVDDGASEAELRDAFRTAFNLAPRDRRSRICYAACLMRKPALRELLHVVLGSPRQP